MDWLSFGICIFGMIAIPLGIAFVSLYLIALTLNTLCRVFFGRHLFADFKPEEAADPWYGGSNLNKEPPEELAVRRKKAKEAEERIREQKRMDRLALSYYVRDASIAGQGQTEIRSVLKQKGWPDDDIAAAFSACGLAAENL